MKKQSNATSAADISRTLRQTMKDSLTECAALLEKPSATVDELFRAVELGLLAYRTARTLRRQLPVLQSPEALS